MEGKSFDPLAPLVGERARVRGHQASPHLRGFVIMSIGILLFILGAVGILLSNLYSAASRSTVDQLQSTQALYIAEAGLEAAIWSLVNNTANCLTVNTPSSMTNSNGGVSAFAGVYTITFSPSSTPSTNATLSAALNSSATIIPASSVSGYDSSGRLRIDNEIVYYWATSTSSAVCGSGVSACFVDVVRAIDGTSAAAHTSGTTLTATAQCLVSSVAGVPDLTNPQAKRTLRRTVPKNLLQDGWAVGNAASGAWTLLHWNKPTVGVWNVFNPSLSPVVNLNAVSLSPHNDAWAAGNSGTALHYAAPSWSSVSTNLSGIFYGISAVSSTQAWTGGDLDRIYQWSGDSSWSTAVSSVGQNINDVELLDTDGNGAADTGWAVGDSQVAHYYNGSIWSSQNSGVTGNLNSVTVISATDAWALSNHANMWHWNGTTWLSAGVNGNSSFQDMSVVANGASYVGWMVGTPQGSNASTWYYNGTSWTRNNTGLPNFLSVTAVTTISASEAWITSTSGKIYYWNGSTWALSYNGSTQLNDIDIKWNPNWTGTSYTGWTETFQ